MTRTAGDPGHLAEHDRLDLINTGAWTSYTPTWSSTGTQPVLGNGTITGRYCLQGKRLDVVVNLTIGATTTNGTLLYSFSLPAGFTTAATAQYNGQAWIVDSGTGYYIGVAHANAGATTFMAYFAYAPNAATAYGADPWSASFPMTPATGDTIQMQITVQTT